MGSRSGVIKNLDDNMVTTLLLPEETHFMALQ